MGKWTHISADWQPSPIVGVGGMVGTFTFTDLSDGEVVPYTAKSKGEFPQKYNKLYVNVITKNPLFEGNVKIMRVDNGQELINQTTEKELNRVGIKAEYTAVDRPQQNSRCEQAETQLDNAATANMAAANVSGNFDSLWPYFTYDAADRRNMSITSHLQTPRASEAKMKQRRPPCGSRAWVKSRGRHRHHHPDRAMLCMFLGYARNHPNTGLFYHFATKRIIMRDSFKVLDKRWDGEPWGSPIHIFNNNEYNRRAEQLKSDIGVGLPIVAEEYVSDSEEDEEESKSSNAERVYYYENASDEEKEEKEEDERVYIRHKGATYEYTTEQKGQQEFDWDNMPPMDRSQRRAVRSKSNA
jgi:hypothetical protein